LNDTHMHTLFSTDSNMKIEEALKKANELGIGITITEHMDLEYPEPKAFIFDIDEYFCAYEQYRCDNVLLGIEIGMRSELAMKSRQVIAGRPLDYIIGSIHVVDGIDIYQEKFYLGRTKQEVYGRYFASMLACLESYDFIDSLGHIDYIARYARYNDAELYFDEFKDHIDQVLVLLAKKQKAIEINTRRLGDKKTVEALIPVYRRFRELGGEYVTIGSDAHTPKDIGKNFKVALDLAEKCSLKPVWFKARKPDYIKQ